MSQNHLSSTDLLTLQILQRELADPTISKNYERELRVRIKYLHSSPLEKAEIRYGIDPEQQLLTIPIIDVTKPKVQFDIGESL